MPIRAIIIMLVVAVVLAVCYREPIYQWFKENLEKDRKEEEPGETPEEEKENKD